MKNFKDFKQELNELSNETITSYLAKASQDIQKRNKKSKGEAPEVIKQAEDHIAKMKAQGKEPSKVISDIVKRHYEGKKEDPNAVFKPEVGSVKKASDGKHYKFHGGQWLEHNPETGKSGRIAKKEIGTELSSMEKSKVQGRLKGIKNASDRIAGVTPKKKVNNVVSGVTPEKKADWMEVANLIHSGKGEDLTDEHREVYKTHGEEIRGELAKRALDRFKSIDRSKPPTKTNVAGVTSKPEEKTSKPFPMQDRPEAAKKKSFKEFSSEIAGKVKTGAEKVKSGASNLKDKVSTKISDKIIDLKVDYKRAKDAYNSVWRPDAEENKRKRKEERQQAVNDIKSTVKDKKIKNPYKIVNPTSGPEVVDAKTEQKKSEKVNSTSFSGIDFSKNLDKHGWIDDIEADEKTNTYKNPYVLHFGYNTMHTNGEVKQHFETIPFTARDDEHAERKSEAVLNNHKKRIAYEFSKSPSDVEHIANFEQKAMYHKRRERSFQFIMSPDDEKETKGNIQYEKKYQPLKWALGTGNFTKRVPVKKDSTSGKPFKPQLFTVYHRSKKEAEAIARHNFLTDNKLPETTPIKIHGSHWV